MTKLLFRLNGVPEDEADDVRALLEQHQFDVYETNSGRWGITTAAIWLRNDDDFEYARSLIDDYQSHRTQQQRQDYEARQQRGEIPPWFVRLQQNPMDHLAVAMAFIMILAVLLWPFLGWF